MSATASEGEDPPDIYLTIGDVRVGVEVTQLSQFTIEPDGSRGNRRTQDIFGLRLLDELDTQFVPLLPGGISLLIGLWVPVPDAARFKNNLWDWVRLIAFSPVVGTKFERIIEGTRISLSVIPERPSGQKVVGFVVNKNSSADISSNAQLILDDRIRVKNDICSKLTGPIWLAVLNDYWLADFDTYRVAYRQQERSHCFERIFLVADDGAVNELTGGL